LGTDAVMLIAAATAIVKVHWTVFIDDLP